MEENIFLADSKPHDLVDYLQGTPSGRSNLGDEVPVLVYRFLEYSLRDALVQRYGKEEQIAVFRQAGRRAGELFAEKFLRLDQPFDAFVRELQARLREFKIGVLRMEDVNEATGRMILTVSEDADCSGLPVPLLESGQSLALCYCDLDHLKSVNDTYGHAEGDRYLCRFTELVRACIREYDVFARLGGDEFCLVLPNCSAATAQKKMLSLQQAFAALPVAPNAPYERMFSFGVAAAEKNHGIVTIDSLLQQADAAMYAQKRRHQTGGKA